MERTNRKKIDDDQLLRMLEEGKTQKEAALYFKVSPVSVCKRLKRLLPAPESVLDKYNLTDRQKRFAIEKAKGLTNTAAVLESYEVSSRQSAKTLGSELMDNPEVQDAITELRACGLTHRYRAYRIKQHVDNRDPNISLKALDMSYRLDGSYAPQRLEVGIEHRRAFEMEISEVERQLELLEKRFGRHERTIEISAAEGDGENMENKSQGSD